MTMWKCMTTQLLYLIIWAGKIMFVYYMKWFWHQVQLFFMPYYEPSAIKISVIDVIIVKSTSKLNYFFKKIKMFLINKIQFYKK